MQVGLHAGQRPVAVEVFEQPLPRPGGRRRIPEAAAMEVEPVGETVCIENRLMAAGHRHLDHALQHARRERRTKPGDVPGRILHQGPGGRHQRRVDAEPRGDRQHVAVAPARRQHHADPRPSHPGDRRDRRVRDLVATVGDGAIDVEHEEADRPRARFTLLRGSRVLAVHSLYGTGNA